MTKKILVIISGSIAGYKALELIRILQKNNYEIEAIITKAGLQFVTELSVSTLIRKQAYTDINSNALNPMAHINLTRGIKLLAVIPASANIIAKAANGIADDLATTTILASLAPVLYIPCMNHYMWINKATQNNIKILKENNATILDPDYGALACQEKGYGHIPEINTIAQYIINHTNG